MAETSNELLDCPFCGGLAEMMNPAPQWYVRCSDCHSTAGRSPYLDAETAARNWNTRTAHETPAAPSKDEVLEAVRSGRVTYPPEILPTGRWTPAEETSQSHVAGDVLPMPLWQFEQRANVLLDELTSRANPDNALLGFICDAVRLARENERLARAPLKASDE
jgi:hypothetical protein